MKVWCRLCAKPNEFARNWINEDDLCEHCKGGGHWSKEPVYVPDPQVDYELSENDRRFLRSLKIDPEWPV